MSQPTADGEPGTSTPHFAIMKLEPYYAHPACGSKGASSTSNLPHNRCLCHREPKCHLGRSVDRIYSKRRDLSDAHGASKTEEDGEDGASGLSETGAAKMVEESGSSDDQVLGNDFCDNCFEGRLLFYSKRDDVQDAFSFLHTGEKSEEMQDTDGDFDLAPEGVDYENLFTSGNSSILPAPKNREDEFARFAYCIGAAAKNKTFDSNMKCYTSKFGNMQLPSACAQVITYGNFLLKGLGVVPKNNASGEQTIAASDKGLSVSRASGLVHKERYSPVAFNLRGNTSSHGDRKGKRKRHLRDSTIESATTVLELPVSESLSRLAIYNFLNDGKKDLSDITRYTRLSLFDSNFMKEQNLSFTKTPWRTFKLRYFFTELENPFATEGPGALTEAELDAKPVRIEFIPSAEFCDVKFGEEQMLMLKKDTRHIIADLGHAVDLDAYEVAPTRQLASRFGPARRCEESEESELESTDAASRSGGASTTSTKKSLIFYEVSGRVFLRSYIAATELCGSKIIETPDDNWGDISGITGAEVVIDGGWTSGIDRMPDSETPTFEPFRPYKPAAFSFNLNTDYRFGNREDSPALFFTKKLIQKYRVERDAVPPLLPPSRGVEYGEFV